MGVDSLEIQVRHAITRKEQKLQLTPAQLRRAMPWLKRENALGNDIFFRPKGDHGLVVLQGMNSTKIEKMKANGYAPTLTVEAGNKVFDAWLKLSDNPLPSDVRKIAEVGLAKSFGANLGEAGKDCFTRLAGFTDQSVASVNKPYVLAHAGAKTVVLGAANALRQAHSFMDHSKTAYQRGKEASKNASLQPKKQLNNDRGRSR